MTKLFDVEASGNQIGSVTTEGWNRFSMVLDEGGEHSIAFGVLDDDDMVVETDLFIDNIQLGPVGNPLAAQEGGDGNDILIGGSGPDALFGNLGHDTIFGGKGQDLIRGGRGSDELHGNGGKDTIFGGRGSDQIFGNRGNDDLHGGRGK